MTDHEMRCIRVLSGVRLSTPEAKEFVLELGRLLHVDPDITLSDKQKSWLAYQTWKYREHFEDEETTIIAREIMESGAELGLLRRTEFMRPARKKVVDIRSKPQ